MPGNDSNITQDSQADEWQIPQMAQPDNTVKTLMYWALGLHIPHGPQRTLLTIIQHVDWREGDNCYASVPTLARESGFSTKTLKKHLRHLLDAGLIVRKRRMGASSFTQLAKEVPPPVGEGSSPTVGEAASPLTGYSSTNPINQSDPPSPTLPDCIDPKPETGETGRDGEIKSSILEEKTKGPGLPTLKAVEAWKAKHYVKGDLDFKAWAVAYYWYLWSGDYVMGGWEMDQGDVANYYEEVLSEAKFEEDLTGKMLKLRLPDGLVTRTGFRCTECHTVSSKPFGIMVKDGEVVTKVCGDCPE